MKTKKKYFTCALAALPLAASLFIGSNAMAATADAEMLSKLQNLIEQQQAQIDAQAKAIRELSSKVGTIAEQPGQSGDNPAAVYVKSRNKTASVKLYGQVNRAILYANDGDDDDIYFVDNGASSTRIGMKASIKSSDDVKVGAKFEADYQSNDNYVINQITPTDSGEFGLRHADLYVASKKFGKLSLGQGDTASNGSAEVTFSDTWLASGVNPDDMAGGILFFDQNADALSGTNIDDVYSSMDGLSRKDRIRYDTPDIVGLQLSVAAMEGNGEDIGLTYSGEFGGITLAGAVAYARSGKLKDWDNQITGSFAILHKSGLNATVAAGQQDMDTTGRDDPSYVYGSIGYKRNFSDIGQTAFSIDYGKWDDLDQDNDEADTFGVQFVQNIDNWGTEFYMGYRNHSLDRDGADMDDIDAFISGARLKF